LTRLVEDVDALCAHLGLERMDLLAHSAGAIPAALYAAAYPARVSRLLLITPGLHAVGVTGSDEELAAVMDRRAAEPWYPAARAAFDKIAAGDERSRPTLRTYLRRHCCHGSSAAGIGAILRRRRLRSCRCGAGRDLQADWSVSPSCHSVDMADDATKGSGAAATSPERLGDLLRHQYDVIARRQAHRYGPTEAKLRHRLRADGPWQKILPGVYSTRTGVVTQEQRQMAALLYAGPGAVLTGAWAVRRYHLECTGLNEADILVPAKSRVQGYGWVRIQHTTRMPSGTSSTKGIVFAPLARAVADAARRMTRAEDVRTLVCQALQKGNISLQALIAELSAGPSAGSGLFRAAIAELVEGVRSEAERDLKIRIDRSDLDKPMYNARLYLADGTFLCIADLWWPRAGVAGEVDSRQYHMSAKDYEYTVDRHNNMEAAGIHVLHFLPRDIKPKWNDIYCNLRNAISEGERRPPLPIIAVPADVTDVNTYLMPKPFE